MFISDSGSKFIYPGSKVKKIPDPESRIRIKDFKYFLTNKLFLSSRKYNPMCSSRISYPDIDFLPMDQK